MARNAILVAVLEDLTNWNFVIRRTHCTIALDWADQFGIQINICGQMLITDCMTASAPPT
jgi:hypothetical protein